MHSGYGVLTLSIISLNDSLDPWSDDVSSGSFKELLLIPEGHLAIQNVLVTLTSQVTAKTNIVRLQSW